MSKWIYKKKYVKWERMVAENYGEFKEDLANVVANFLEDFQAKYKKYSDKEFLINAYPFINSKLCFNQETRC